jgi:aspartyl-tRNA(Asn)/glutamyl-tRNA(Gln) amidotransferase subunit A
MSDELTALCLADAAAAVAAGTVSCAALTEAYLARIEAVEPAINAYVTVCADRARADAARADAEIRAGGHRGPLHGMPMGLKDLFDTAGVRTTSGSSLRRDHVPAADSTVAARLRGAGAVLLGKHATHEFAWGGTTDNPHFGPTRNPYDPTRIPGGSSGGSAASVVAHTAVASVGTDTCGSVRIPASLSGCVGLKPTYGWVDMAGVTPLAPSLDHAGPITRTVADAALVYAALAGTAAPALGPDLPPGLRVGLLRGWFVDVIDPEVAAAVDATAARLAARGCTVVELAVPDPGPVIERIFDIVRAEAGEYHRADFARAPEAFGGDLRAVLSQPAPTTDDLAAGRDTIERLAGWLRQELSGVVDVLLTATTPAPAPPIGSRRVRIGEADLHIEWMLTRLTSIFNVARLPALSVPVGLTRAGLPVGAQLVGRPLTEPTLLAVGQAAEVTLAPPALPS